MKLPLGNRTLRAVVLLGLAGALLAACSSSQTSSSAPAKPGEIVVTATDLKFDPTTITVTAGQPVTIRLVNKGALEHDLSIEGLGQNAAVKAAAGANATLQFTPDKKGTFDFVCTVPGHKEAGMVGKLVVN